MHKKYSPQYGKTPPLKRQRPDCPTPHKRAYTEDQAYRKALGSSGTFGKAVRVYRCQCGYQHLTTRVIPIGKTA
jgi:hypothetical protein